MYTLYTYTYILEVDKIIIHTLIDLSKKGNFDEICYGSNLYT